MSWIHEIFCRHNYVLRETIGIYRSLKHYGDGIPDYHKYLYQCSKCSKFKKVKT